MHTITVVCYWLRNRLTDRRTPYISIDYSLIRGSGGILMWRAPMLHSMHFICTTKLHLLSCYYRFYQFHSLQLICKPDMTRIEAFVKYRYLHANYPPFIYPKAVLVDQNRLIVKLDVSNQLITLANIFKKL